MPEVNIIENTAIQRRLRRTIYNFDVVPFPSSGLIERNVSHIYQDLNIGFAHGISSVYPEGWRDDMKIDYFRVYQPIDKYQSETKNYK